MKVAVTVVLAVTVTPHGFVVEHPPPLKLVNVEAVDGEAETETKVP